jgi:hypothetical protein
LSSMLYTYVYFIAFSIMFKNSDISFPHSSVTASKTSSSLIFPYW